MDISFLPEHQQDFVKQQAKRLGYDSPSKWVQDLAQEAIFDRMLEASPELRAKLDASLEKGLEDVKAGRTTPIEECWVHLHKGTKPTTGFKDSEVV